MSQERVNFGSKLGMVLATAGSAVGLGNVWRFPYMAGQNGGASFILIYIGCVLLLGIPCVWQDGQGGLVALHRMYERVDGFHHHELLCRGVWLVSAIHFRFGWRRT